MIPYGAAYPITVVFIFIVMEKMILFHIAGIPVFGLIIGMCHKMRPFIEKVIKYHTGNNYRSHFHRIGNQVSNCKVKKQDWYSQPDLSKNKFYSFGILMVSIMNIVKKNP